MKCKHKEASVERRTFYEVLFCLKIVGGWLPSTIKRSYQKSLYRLFSFFAYTICITQVALVFIYIIVEDTDLEELLGTWFVLAPLLYTLSNVINLLRKRDLLYDHLRKSILADRWTRFRDANEKSIVEKSKKTEVLIFKLWGGSLLLNGVCFILYPILGGNPNNQLMWECYTPCDVNEPICFWGFYVYQAYCYATISATNAAHDCLVYSLCERMCAYVKIFQYRLKLLPELVKTGALCTLESELDYLKQCITDHQKISMMANELHVLFNISIFVYFFLSFTVMCANVFYLSNQVLFSSHFLSVFIHLYCIGVENLFYSWYGYKFQEITEQIPYTIFSMDWTVLNKNTVKLLRFTMLFASRPISLFNNFLVDLSPEMFLKVVKLAYSTFNVLKASN